MADLIDTEALVEPLALIICVAGKCCECRRRGETPCAGEQDRARAAIAYLLPHIIELCAEEAETTTMRAFEGNGETDEAFGAKAAAVDIRALIPKGGDHA